MRDKLKIDKAIVGVIGLGYVGLPLAEAFSKSFRVIGYDIDSDRVNKLNQDNDNQNLLLTANPEDISQADFIYHTLYLLSSSFACIILSNHKSEAYL